ncbi:MAG: hypothetical protein KKB82_00170 [Candidatus Omnitrophica bacterium]|nr:hypothetical protein [Candidatus Omnitrophota bacterium]MBU1924317.1 hypothetical protein [Candidatus Omnitrophota bacterium]
MNNKKGIMLVIALIVIVLLTILSTGIFVRSISETKSAAVFTNAKRAFWLAESGIQKGIYELNYNGAWSGTTQNSLSSGGDYEISLTSLSGSRYQITSTSYFPSKAAANAVARTITAILKKSFSFDYATYAGADLSLAGNAATNSYSSSEGAYGTSSINANGDVGTNGDISGSGNNYAVNGDAVISPDGEFDESDHISGDIVQQPEVTLILPIVPATLAALSSSGSISSTTTLSSGDYKYLNINLSSSDTLTITGPVNLYLTGATSISTSGTSSIVVDSASSGAVTIYFDGDVDLTGQGITNATNTPSNLLLLGTNSSEQDFDVSGQADFCGAVYAPTADMRISGQGTLCGSFVGNDVALSGNAAIHYDEDLEDMELDLGSYQVESWKDSQSPYAVTP